ncbi:hypothetical protein KCV07_g515, partial [Aureobasidium melanogenum]
MVLWPQLCWTRWGPTEPERDIVSLLECVDFEVVDHINNVSFLMPRLPMSLRYTIASRPLFAGTLRCDGAFEVVEGVGIESISCDRGEVGPMPGIDYSE